MEDTRCFVYVCTVKPWHFVFQLWFFILFTVGKPCCAVGVYKVDMWECECVCGASVCVCVCVCVCCILYSLYKYLWREKEGGREKERESV